MAGWSSFTTRRSTARRRAGTVSELAFDVIRSARLKAGAGGDAADVTEECVPTLEELLEEARGKITVNIDTSSPVTCLRSWKPYCASASQIRFW